MITRDSSPSSPPMLSHSPNALLSARLDAMLFASTALDTLSNELLFVVDVVVVVVVVDFVDSLFRLLFVCLLMALVELTNELKTIEMACDEVTFELALAFLSLSSQLQQSRIRNRHQRYNQKTRPKLRNSKVFAQLLSRVLVLGNRMNATSIRGFRLSSLLKVIGFFQLLFDWFEMKFGDLHFVFCFIITQQQTHDIEILGLQLSETKSNVRGLTMLHYVASMIRVWWQREVSANRFRSRVFVRLFVSFACQRFNSLRVLARRTIIGCVC
jgi:hypothetical protein